MSMVDETPRASDIVSASPPSPPPSRATRLRRAVVGLAWTLTVAFWTAVAAVLNGAGTPRQQAIANAIWNAYRTAPTGPQAGLTLIFVTLLILEVAASYGIWRERDKLQESVRNASSVAAQAAARDMQVAADRASDAASKVYNAAQNLGGIVDDLKSAYPSSNEAGKLPLILARDLTRERMGDDHAATFPLVTTPQLTRARERAEAVLASFMGDTIPIKRGILVVGESNVGKTRLAFDTLTEVLRDWYVLRWQVGASEAQLPLADIEDHKVAVFVDDLQEYVAGSTESSSAGVTAALASPAATTLRDVLVSIRQKRPRTPVVATCRAEELARVRNSPLAHLFDELAVIELQPLPKDRDDPEARRVISELANSGEMESEQYDGTIGSPKSPQDAPRLQAGEECGAARRRQYPLTDITRQS